jgi:tRNA(Ile)-lysidine synthase
MQTSFTLQIPAELDRLYIACSGGIDSSVLLHLLQAGCEHSRLIVWHINHGLQANAHETEQFVRNQAARYGLMFRVDHLDMDAAGSNLEARARALRYALFAAALTSKDALLTAHHQNDQAETLLFNLMRGAGSAGLSAIARSRVLGQGVLLRPLLEYSRQQLEQYASQNCLEWIDDPSNADDHFDRNYLRHEIIPRLIKRWPAAVTQLQRVSELQQESEQLHLALAELDYASASAQRPFSSGGCLLIKALFKLTFERQKNLIRYWIKSQGQGVLGFHKMQTLLKQLHARNDAMPCIQGDGYSLRCYRGALYLVENTAPPRLQASYQVHAVEATQIDELNLKISRQQIFEQIMLRDEGQIVTLRFRQAEKADRPFNYAHRLKRLFQQHRIPPWIRDRIPQIFLDDELVGLLL